MLFPLRLLLSLVGFLLGKKIQLNILLLNRILLIVQILPQILHEKELLFKTENSS